MSRCGTRAVSDGIGRAKILQALRNHGGNRTKAALQLGLHRHTLLKDMRRLGIPEDLSSE